MSWRGRRVTEPKPVVRTPLDDYGVQSTKGLDPLYKGMDHAKSQLRNIEHRLHEAERPSNAVTIEESLNIAVDRVPSYILNPHEKTSSILVDSSGKTRHLRSREEIARKVSRLDDKYKDRRQRSPLREPNQITERKVAWVEDDLGSTATTTTGYKSATGSTLRGLSSFGTRSGVPGGTALSDGTSVNFLNDKDDGLLTKDGGVRGYLDLPGRWTKVDVGVPTAGVSQGRARKTADPLASTYPPKASGAAEAGTASRLTADVGGATSAMTASGSSAASAPPHVNSTYTLNGESSTSTSPNSSRFKHKKSLRDLENSSDTLAKLREKVRQQKMIISSGESQGSSENDLHVTHTLNDPVVARAPVQKEPPVMVRKVAAGPPVPRYQGFSETEMKYRLPDGKMVKVSDIRRRKLKKLRKEAPLKEKHASAEPEEKKPPKPVRVVAPQKKPTKTERQTGDIITTRSWRVGAKLVLQELGPNKLPKMGDSPPSKEKPDQVQKDETKASIPLSSEARSVLRDLQSPAGSEDEEGTDDKGIEDTKKPHKRKRPKPLQTGDANEDAEDEKQAKVRHYDSEEVKRFMAKQRSERRMRQQEESARSQQLREQRESQLAELYRRQRGASRQPPTAALLPGPKGSALPARTVTLDKNQEDRIKHSGESDKENRGGAWGEVSSSDSTLSGGSGPGSTQMDAFKLAAADAEYFIKKYSTRSPELNDLITKYSSSGQRSGDLEMPDDSAAAKPSGLAGTRTLEVDSYLNKYSSVAGAAPGLGSADSGLGATASRFLVDSGLKADDIVARFAGRAANIKSNFPGDNVGGAASRTGASTMPTYLREPAAMTLPNTPFSASTTTAGASFNSRQKRIRALAENSSLLAHRLTSEQQRLASLSQSRATSERWAQPREEMEEDAYRTRYDRMTGGRDNYNVYGSDLPGVSSLSRHMPKSREELERDLAATKIQTAYRSHVVRQDSSPERVYQHMKSDDGLSDMSDSTLHEDELYQPLPVSKAPTAKIRLPGTAAVAAGRESGRTRPAVSGRWEEPAADPYSILNVLARRKDPLSQDRYKRVGLFDDTEPEQEELHDHTLNSLSDNVSLSDDSTFTGEAPTDKDRSTKQQSHHSASHHSVSHHSASHHSVSQRSRSPVSVSQLSEDDSSLTDYTKSYTESRSRPALSQRSARSATGALSHRSAQSGVSRAVSVKSDKKTTLEDQVPVVPRAQAAPAVSGHEELEEEDQDDTLEGPASPSLVSDLDDKHEDDAALSVEVSDVSESSDLSVADRSAGNRRAYAPGGIAYRPGLVSGRLSPGGLERRMTAELNLLDCMEESVRQLTAVDRTRGISLAQQESVSLAQILKAQEQGHAQQLAAYQRDSEFLTRELTGAQRMAASAAEGAAHTVEKARQETTRSLQESTMNLIATQSEAAKATAEAARQLAEVKVAASGAAANITNENTSRLIHETAVATATAVSSVLHDKVGKRVGVGAEDHGTQYSKRSVRTSGESFTSDTYDSDFSQSVSATRSHTRSKALPASRSESRVSYTRDVETASAGTSPAATGSIKTGSVVTASDLSKHTASSIATESGVGGIAGSHDNSKSESILEEVFSEKIQDDYSIDFDTSVTEEEMEKSLREVLPSQDHRKKIKRTSSQSDLSSVASDDHKEALNSLSTPSSRRLSFEGDSFTKFTVDMVRQYMREEEIRAQHQGALLKLRERALKEKTQAELAWLEQQKTRGRDKGADEVYPLIKKKRRGLLLKLQQEQAEIRRLKEASRAASKERQFLLMQSQEIARLRQTTQQITKKTRRANSKVEQWLCDLDSSSLEVDTYSSLPQVKDKIKSGPAAAAEGLDVPTEDELNFNLDDSEITSLASPSKDGESGEGAEKKADLKPLQKLRKMKLDDKFLTHREQQLLQRRLQVEGLLEWKQKLDREEAEIEAMEKAALNLTKKDKAAKEKAAKEKAAKEKAAKDTRDKTDKKDKDKPVVTPRSARADTIASELDSIKEESVSESLSMSVSTRSTRRTPRTDTEITEDVPETVRSRASLSSVREQLVTNGHTTASIAEEIPTSRSGKRTPDSSEDANVTTSTTHEDYTNETFESDAGTATITAPAPAGAKKGSASPPKLQLGAKEGPGAGRAPRSPKSPLKSPIRRGSESESEDSLSVAHSETASDQSDLENRIRALSEDLKRRKTEAERLKKEAKKQQKERLRQEELTLKKQIEAYDKYIAEARLEITDDLELQERPTAVPQIKKPTPGQKRSPPSLPRTPHDQRSRVDSDGSRSSSSLENGGQSPGHSAPLSPITPGGHDEQITGKTTSFADSISESLMSPQITGISQKKTSTPEDRSTFESRSRFIEQSETIDEVPEEVSAVDLAESESEVKLRLDISKAEDSTKAAPSELQQPNTARSLKSITEDVPTESAADSRPQSRVESRDERSAALSKSEKISTAISEKSIKSHYSTDFGDDSDHSVSRKSDKSFTYSTSKTSHSTTTTYSDEFTDGTTGKSSPRRKEASVSKKSKDDSKSIVEDSIQTEEEVSEQLDAESDDEEQGVMLDIDAVPSPRITTAPEPDPLSHLSIGDRVLVGGARPGILRFKGRVKFAEGFFGGVELNKADGTNNGSKEGVEYFQCASNHGIFAPPEKLEPLPANWKEDEPEASAGDSDISEATIHEGDEDSQKIAELRKDVTEPEQESVVKATTPRDGDESIAEDISIATTVDSELERVISSAAAAVESFGAEQLETHSGNASPVDTTVSDALSPREPPKADLEKVVDSITDGILHMVVKDSVESAGEVAQKIVAKRHTAESTTAQKDPVPKVEAKPPAPTADDASVPASKTQQKQESSDQAVEVATQKLLTESISQILSIYKKKQKSDETPEKKDSEETDSTIEPPQEKSENIVMRPPDILTLDDTGFDPFPGLSEGFGTGKKKKSKAKKAAMLDDLDQLYDELGALTGDTDEWFDDDFGLGIQKRAPPPYPGTPQEKKDKTDAGELRLDLRRVTQEPFFAVPHRADEVRHLVTRAVNHFWELRRFGESWSDVSRAPDEYFRPDDARASDMESSNRCAYKQLVFDLTGEILTDIYQAEQNEEEEPCSWMPPRRSRQRYYRGRDPPTMREMVEPVVEEQVLRLSGLKTADRPDVRLAKWSSRKKRDRVDNVLLQELVEEEPDWVDYNEDETTVKMQVADSIFDSLLIETASVFTRIAQRRAV